MVTLRHRESSIIACALFTYLLLQIFSTFGKRSCQRSNLPNGIDSYFENDVVLEFEKFGFDCFNNASEQSHCGIAKNSTRIAVNGKVWNNENDKVKLFTNLEVEREPQQEFKKGPKLITDRALDGESRPKLDLLSCEDIEKLFEPDVKKDERTSGDINESYGNVNHPIIGKTPCVRKQVRRSSAKAFQTLDTEREKRFALGTDTRISNRLLGVCTGSDDLNIIVETRPETTTALCDEDEGEEETLNYAQSRCFQNEKLISLIEKSEDKTRAAFAFIKEILCLFSEIERKKFFVQDIHGKHISVSSNFSVIFNDVDVLSHHGSRNILSGSTCKYDENCPAPSGKLWKNGSANRVVYEKCKDPVPLCAGTSCTGYNSSLHMCGIVRWILQPLYSYFKRTQDRSRITSIMMASMNGWPFLRHSATESCKKAIVSLGLYDKDLKLANGPLKRKNGFHIGPRITQEKI